jgi:hypothetical protein
LNARIRRVSEVIEVHRAMTFLISLSLILPLWARWNLTVALKPALSPQPLHIHRNRIQ